MLLKVAIGTEDGALWRKVRSTHLQLNRRQVKSTMPLQDTDQAASTIKAKKLADCWVKERKDSLLYVPTLLYAITVVRRRRGSSHEVGVNGRNLCVLCVDRNGRRCGAPNPATMWRCPRAMARPDPSYHRGSDLDPDT